MDLEEVMVHHPLHQVEDAPPGQHPAHQMTPGPGPSGADRRPQGCQPRYHQEPGGRMKETVGGYVRLQVSEVGGGRLLADQVVPLQDLMEDDPVDEASESQTQEEAREPQRCGPTRDLWLGAGGGVCHGRRIPLPR